MRASVLRTLDLAGAWTVSDVARSGHALLRSANEGLLLVAPNDAVRQWPTERGHGCLSPTGRVLVFRRTTRTSRSQVVLLSSEHERVVPLVAEVQLEHGFETLEWASDETFWLAGHEPGQENIWIGELDLDGRVRRSISIAHAHGEGMIDVSAAGRERAWLTWGNGQDGVWAYAVRGQGDRLRVDRVPAEWVLDGVFEESTGDSISIEGGNVVRRDSALMVCGSVDPGPVRLDRLIQHPRSVVAVNDGTFKAWALGARGDRVGDALDLTTLFDSKLSPTSLRTEGVGHVLVTSASTQDRKKTRLVFWEPDL